MATTVITAFNEFLRDSVNLDDSKTKTANSSRDWLIGKIEAFPATQTNFPSLYEEKSINFGSFARKTKKRPLDDIDLMICLKGDGAVYDDSGDIVRINVREGTTLEKYCHSETFLNSIRIVNKFVSSLISIPQYQQADISRNQEAAVLRLTSYDWDFDIVPCFLTTENTLGISYYLIPDGSGHWKKTDPRIDKNRVTSINQKLEGNVLNMIRLIKFWNSRSTMPSVSSYLLEVLVLNYYHNRSSCSVYVDVELQGLLTYISSFILYSVSDPKGIDSNINHTSAADRQKVSERAVIDAYKVAIARDLENNKLYEESINKWIEIFGVSFPAYG